VPVTGEPGAVAEFGLSGAGGQGGGDLVRGSAVVAGFGDELREHALGLAGEAGGEGDGGDCVAGPFPAGFGELANAPVCHLNLRDNLLRWPPLAAGQGASAWGRRLSFFLVAVAGMSGSRKVACG
jgi:hypothetical protein